MILTLKIVGLAFELNRSYIRNLDENTKKSDLEEQENIKANLSVTEMFHYCFNYVGVLTGKSVFLFLLSNFGFSLTFDTLCRY